MLIIESRSRMHGAPGTLPRVSLARPFQPKRMSPAGCRVSLLVAITAALLTAGGCKSPGWGRWSEPASVSPQGTLSDPVWQNQEYNAEKSDFVVHQHEFRDETEFLNTGGLDHVKQIAARILAGQDAQVIVERSQLSAKPNTQHKFPVHPNPDLDLRRRDIVVRCLLALHIPDADARVVVVPDLAPEYRAGDPAATYYDDRGNNDRNFGGTLSGVGWGGGGGGGVW